MTGEPFGEPQVNVWIKADEALVSAELPGVSQEDVDISVKDGTVTLRGNRRAKEEKQQEESLYRRGERAAGQFVRVLELPFRIDSARVSARLDKGILWVTLPRAEADKPRKIAVHAG